MTVEQNIKEGKNNLELSVDFIITERTFTAA
jgi:hypothetical protein